MYIKWILNTLFCNGDNDDDDDDDDDVDVAEEGGSIYSIHLTKLYEILYKVDK